VQHGREPRRDIAGRRRLVGDAVLDRRAAGERDELILPVSEMNPWITPRTAHNSCCMTPCLLLPLARVRTVAVPAIKRRTDTLAYNLGYFMRTLAMPKTAEPWSLTSLREKLIKIGAKVVSHGRYVTFQMAEVAVPRQMFQEILSLIARLRAPPAPA
jgi:hypothetical protein